MLKISFDLGHPAHYLLFRKVLSESDKIGFEPFIFIQEKGSLKKLLIEDNLNFYIRKNKQTTLSRVSLLPKDIIQIRELMKKKKINVNFGKCSIVGSWAAKSLNKRTIVFDDTDTAPGQIFLFRWPATEIWTPHIYNRNLGSKQKRFIGIFQLAYLHPTVFKPEKSIPESLGLLEQGKPIFIRIIEYQAAHDWKYKNKRDNFEHIIDELNKDYTIILSIEGGKYPKKWNKYVRKFKPSEYHHILAYSSLYIGSGASTAAEAAVLGVPSIYTNYIKPGFINWLEKDYKIIKSITSDSLVLEDIEKILEENKTKWKEIQNKILNNCINVPNLINELIRKEIEIYLSK